MNESATPPLTPTTAHDDRLLFQPFQLGEFTLKNRMVMPAIGTEYAERGVVSERMIRYYERRAEGGVGLMHVELCAVDLSGSTNDHQLRLDEDSFIPGMKTLVDRVRTHGIPLVLQLGHAGRQMSKRMSGRQPVAPSAVPCPLIKDVPRALETEEVDLLGERFAAAALRAKKAGFDGIQFHGAHGYLLHQFVSPASNQRDDRFGGSWANRLRFPVETVRRVRSAVGAGFLLGYKLSAREYIDDGLTLEEMTEFARELETAGIDYIEVSAGTFSHMQHMVQPMLYKRGHLVQFASYMKQHLHIPVIAVGRINDPELAEGILREGHADLVAIGRGLLADPDLPNKARLGRLDDIRRCVACNECISLAFAQKEVACLINPELSREGMVDLRPVRLARKVLVVGAGPAGIQAALTASERGHIVTLCDSNAWLGGKLPIVAAPPGKDEFNYYLHYLRHRIAAAKVDVRLSTRVTADFVAQMRPDEILIATGAHPEMPSISGVEADHVCSADEALSRPIKGKRVVVIGASGTGCECAQYLHARGHEVTVVARGMKAARSIEPITRTVLLKEMRDAGIRTVFDVDCLRIEDDRVDCVDSGGNNSMIACDSVVIARGYESQAQLADELRAEGWSVHVIGDAVQSRKIIEAVTEGFLTAAAL